MPRKRHRNFLGIDREERRKQEMLAAIKKKGHDANSLEKKLLEKNS